MMANVKLQHHNLTTVDDTERCSVEDPCGSSGLSFTYKAVNIHTVRSSLQAMAQTTVHVKQTFSTTS